MPYKEKLRNPSLNSKKKPQYKVINWTEYNKSLKRRGELSLYFPYGELKPQFINEIPYTLDISGRQAIYKQPLNVHGIEITDTEIGAVER